MVANWDILNKEFDDLLDRLSDDEWIAWHEKIETQKKMLRLDLLLKAEIQAAKILGSKQSGNSIYKAELSSSCSIGSGDDIATLSLELDCTGNCLPSAA